MNKILVEKGVIQADAVEIGEQWHSQAMKTSKKKG